MTTVPAAIIELFPIFTPSKIITLSPIHTLSPITIGPLEYNLLHFGGTSNSSKLCAPP